MPASTLKHLYANFVNESYWLTQAFDSCVNQLNELDHPKDLNMVRLKGEMATVRLHDAWARFSRELVFTSASERPYTLSGIRLPLAPHVASRQDVVAKVLASTRSRHEPSWHDSTKCIKAATILSVQNLSTIRDAISSTNSPIVELTAVRHFFVHRWEGTATQVRSQPFYRSGMELTIESLLGQVTSSGQNLFEVWVDSLRLVAYAAIQ